MGAGILSEAERLELVVDKMIAAVGIEEANEMIDISLLGSVMNPVISHVNLYLANTFYEKGNDFGETGEWEKARGLYLAAVNRFGGVCHSQRPENLNTEILDKIMKFAGDLIGSEGNHLVHEARRLLETTPDYSREPNDLSLKDSEHYVSKDTEVKQWLWTAD